MKCSAFIATSVDGYIATPEGSVAWLDTAGVTPPEGASDDGGFGRFLASVDCLVMGRKTLEVIAGFNLTSEQWPYGDRPVYVLSRSLDAIPAGLPGRVILHRGDLPALMASLTADGFTHAYVDGGSVITQCLALGFMDELCITQAPVLLGEGIPLFGHLPASISLTHVAAELLPNNFLQVTYRVKPSPETP